jgi:uncharacterized protein YfaT (DUF1175 family)
MNSSDSEKRFWNNYLDLLSQYQIKSDFFTWYVRHCETFIRTIPETRLKQHTSQTVSSYLEALINASDKTAWQKKQSIEALSLLFLSIKAPLHSQIDWEY